MVELRIEGLPGEVDAACERLGEVFEVLEVSKDYPNRRGSRLVRRFVKVAQRIEKGADREEGELGRAGLGDLIQALLAEDHRVVRLAINPTPELSAYHEGYQAALMNLAWLAGLIPSGEGEVNSPAADPEHNEKAICKNCGNEVWYSQFSGWHHTDMEPVMVDPKTRRISGICSWPAPKVKRKPGRAQVQGAKPFVTLFGRRTGVLDGDRSGADSRVGESEVGG